MSAASIGAVMPRGTSLAREWLRRIRERVQIGDHIGAVLRLGQTRKGHLRALDVRLRLPEPLVERVRAPGAALLLERLGEGEAAALCHRLLQDTLEIWDHPVWPPPLARWARPAPPPRLPA